jgi:hypothetical protein
MYTLRFWAYSRYYKVERRRGQKMLVMVREDFETEAEREEREATEAGMFTIEFPKESIREILDMIDEHEYESWRATQV